MTHDDPITRPDPHALRFRLYERALHPEWLTLFAVRRIRYAGHTISAGILAGGHMFQWHRDSVAFTEVLAAQTDLPTAGLRLDHAVTDGRGAKVVQPDGLRFETTSQVEKLTPAVFRQVHGELAHDGCRSGLVFHFPNHGRIGLGPLGYLTVEPVPAGLVFCAFHTFPELFTIVKTQSLIDFAAAPAPMLQDRSRRSE